jgi:drug/metabolite transporter (DMT)-like permease
MRSELIIHYQSSTLRKILAKLFLLAYSKTDAGLPRGSSHPQVLRVPLMLMRLKADLILLLTAIIWGSGFIAQRVAAQHLGVFFFNGSRFVLASVALLPISQLHRNFDRDMLRWSLLGGALLFFAGALQQAGMRWTTAANGGFITGLYVIIVPLILLLGWRQKLSWLNWAAAVIAVIGVKMLSSPGALELAPGDALVLLSAVLWAGHVIVVGKAAGRLDLLAFANGQFLVCAVLNLIVALFFELPSAGDLQGIWWTILYAGIFPSAIGFTLQVVGQKHAPPADAALILSLESVAAAVFGFYLLGESLAAGQIAGCGLILAAIVMVQLKGLNGVGRTTQPATQ